MPRDAVCGTFGNSASGRRTHTGLNVSQFLLIKSFDSLQLPLKCKPRSGARQPPDQIEFAFLYQTFCFALFSFANSNMPLVPPDFDGRGLDGGSTYDSWPELRGGGC